MNYSVKFLKCFYVNLSEKNPSVEISSVALPTSYDGSTEHFASALDRTLETDIRTPKSKV